MKRTPPPLIPVLRSSTQARLLTRLLTDPQQEHSLTALAEEAETSVATAMREVDRAEEAGLVRSRNVGRTRLVQANESSPYFRPLSELLLVAFGPLTVVAEELARVEGVGEAYIFGSWAARYRGEAGRAPADVDVLVIGRPAPYDVYDAAERAEKRLGRPVQITIRKPEHWNRPGDDPFLAEVRRRPLVPLFADENGDGS